MKFIKSALFILLSVGAFLTFAEQTATISQQELLSLMATPENKTVVLDVRTAEEFAEGHIAGAINISHEQINDNLSKIIALKDQTVVVHCRSGRRAISAENDLRAAGFSDLRHLEGDMNGWQSADLPLVK
ncbi:rhodanese-like domain-containing protein [Colwellia sp. BRX10-3]|uniref:rhodanese-like domain-containing protein n=1 Tax=Colwellia sp. BRX10-3 TaxID=2759844 RepID=UPI0015F6FCEC|nr:rhodanese-like domain-containing protein [Colwellia sp. BRX10-3]MBA6389834.1 rhodanese-like domain-containing protein [Colwellia sp. BRX10-3]